MSSEPGIYPSSSYNADTEAQHFSHRITLVSIRRAEFIAECTLSMAFLSQLLKGISIFICIVYLLNSALQIQYTPISQKLLALFHITEIFVRHACIFKSPHFHRFLECLELQQIISINPFLSHHSFKKITIRENRRLSEGLQKTLRREWQWAGMGCSGSGGVTVPGDVPDMCGGGTEGHG